MSDNYPASPVPACYAPEPRERNSRTQCPGWSARQMSPRAQRPAGTACSRHRPLAALGWLHRASPRGTIRCTGAWRDVPAVGFCLGAVSMTTGQYRLSGRVGGLLALRIIRYEQSDVTPR